MADSHIYIILARGNSKGVRRKNVREVGGIPLVVRSVAAAIESAVTRDVFVSTDDSEISALASAAGATVISRPDHLAADDTSSEDALIHALSELGRSDGKLILIQPTSPFLTGTDLERLAGLSESFESALTVSESHRFIWRADSDNSLTGVNHDPRIRLRRQDLRDHEVFENGAAYLMDIPLFLEKKHRFFGRIGYVIMPSIRSIEIDSEDDLAFANIISTHLSGLPT